MGKLYKDYPPYAGNEPYMFLCFSSTDEQRVRPVLSSLFSRGCRVWYSTGKAKNKSEYDAVSDRIAGASLAVVFLTENACSDTSLKNDIKFSFRKGTKIIILRADPVSSNLPLGLPEELPSAESTDELLRTEGFHAGLIGQPNEKKHSAAKVIAAVLLALTLSVGVWAGIRISGGKPLAIDPREVTELRLRSLPEDPKEFEQYPNLEKLIVPQSLAPEAFDRYGDDYVIVLSEG